MALLLFPQRCIRENFCQTWDHSSSSIDWVSKTSRNELTSMENSSEDIDLRFTSIVYTTYMPEFSIFQCLPVLKLSSINNHCNYSSIMTNILLSLERQDDLLYNSSMCIVSFVSCSIIMKNHHCGRCATLVYQLPCYEKQCRLPTANRILPSSSTTTIASQLHPS